MKVSSFARIIKKSHSASLRWWKFHLMHVYFKIRVHQIEALKLPPWHSWVVIAHQFHIKFVPHVPKEVTSLCQSHSVASRGKWHIFSLKSVTLIQFLSSASAITDRKSLLYSKPSSSHFCKVVAAVPNWTNSKKCFRLICRFCLLILSLVFLLNPWVTHGE